ncbi:MbtH family protein [Kitasatospora sp. HPMI-4]|uniref:MbtH family protein n=1 Tax=Kitasatospora sp. HPMI-4 TaxID=3448443 RepID=UPI003F1A0EB9
MATSPFDDENSDYLVLINDEQQYSLWPAFAAIPQGWTVALDRSARAQCAEYIRTHWSDLRPRSVRDEMSGAR